MFSYGEPSDVRPPASRRGRRRVAPYFHTGRRAGCRPRGSVGGARRREARVPRREAPCFLTERRRRGRVPGEGAPRDETVEVAWSRSRGGKEFLEPSAFKTFPARILKLKIYAFVAKLSLFPLPLFGCCKTTPTTQTAKSQRLGLGLVLSHYFRGLLTPSVGKARLLERRKGAAPCGSFRSTGSAERVLGLVQKRTFP